PVARGSRPDRALQPQPAQQVPHRAHAGAEAGGRERPRVCAARGRPAAVRLRVGRMSRRVVVTGGVVFSGSHVVDAHVAAGDEVTVLDDLSSGRAANVPEAARLVRADVRSATARALVADGAFTILNHHATQMDVRRSVADPVFDADVNVLGLLNLLEGARTGGVRRVVFASSGGTVYGEGASLPIPETAAKLPASPYGTAKLTPEYYLAMFSQLYGVEAVALRYSNVYGPRQNPHGEAGGAADLGRPPARG